MTEGDLIEEEVVLRVGLALTVTIEDWEDIDCVTVQLADDCGRGVPVEVDNEVPILYFYPPHTGIYRLMVLLQGLSQGSTSAPPSIK